jgi:peptidoglycan/LPS O-acetylase OafA/YrhL
MQKETCMMTDNLQTGVTENKKNYDVLDLTKFILSFLIVAIHTSLFPHILYPWLRVAVPLFFVISSFLLFSKINSSTSVDKRKIVRKFIVRQIKLYLF